MSDLLGQALPHSDESERVILGAILLDNKTAAEVFDVLQAADFYSVFHQKVFAAMEQIFHRGEVIEPVLIFQALKSSNIDLTTVANLSHGVPPFIKLGPHIQILKNKAAARELVRTCGAIINDALETDDAAAAMLDRAEQAIFSVRRDDNTTEAERFTELAREVVETKKHQIAEGIEVEGFRTGLKDLDSQTGGFKRTELIIIAGRPSMGKTALGTQTMYDGLGPEDVGIYFSAEMSKAAIVSRIICQQALVNLWAFNHNKLGANDWRRIDYYFSPFPNKNLFIDDTPAITTGQMLTRSRRLKAKHKRLDVIMVDHMHLMGSKMRTDNRREQLSEISRELKALAKTMDCPVIALAQLSRAPEIRANPEPVLADLRESGTIEQDADTVLLLYRPSYYEKDKSKKEAVAGSSKIIIAKQRNGPTEHVEVTWRKEQAKFGDAYRER